MTETTEQDAPPRPAEPGKRKARRERSRREVPAWLRGPWMRGIAIGIVVILVGAAIYSIGENLTTAEPAHVTVAVDGPPGGIMPGERFKVSGVVTPGTERPVYLEHRNGAIWSRVATVQSDSDGSYEFPEARALEGSHFRVALPAINNFGRTHPAVDVAIPGLRIVPQKVSDFSVLPGIVQNGPLAADAYIWAHGTVRREPATILLGAARRNVAVRSMN